MFRNPSYLIILEQLNGRTDSSGRGTEGTRRFSMLEYHDVVNLRLDTIYEYGAVMLLSDTTRTCCLPGARICVQIKMHGSQYFLATLPLLRLSTT